jgi:hypothetical protein
MIVHVIVVSYWITHRSSFRPIRAHLSLMAHCRKEINPGDSVCSVCRKIWEAFKILGGVFPKTEIIYETLTAKTQWKHEHKIIYT